MADATWTFTALVLSALAGAGWWTAILFARRAFRAERQRDEWREAYFGKGENCDRA